jgi:hypothetical protein
MQHNLIFYTFGLNNNDYFITNVHKYIEIKPLIINHIYNNNINAILDKQLNTDSLFIISETSIDYDIINIPLYPIILYNKKCIIITSILLQQIGGIPIHNNFDTVLINIVGNIKKYIGGILTDNINKIKTCKCDTYKNNFGTTLFDKSSSVIKINNKNSVKNFTNCYHGWLSKSTKLNLKYALDNYKPKNIVELGSWYGKSASYMIELLPTSNFYFFDKFQNICTSPYKIDKFNVLNKFYFTYPRLETFYKNITDLQPKGNIYAIRKNAFESLDMLKQHNIDVDMIFIDFIKKTHELTQFLNKCVKIYPHAVIVGDDYVFDTVKQALIKFMAINKNKYHIGFLPESYIISSHNLINHDKLYTIIKKNDNNKNVNLEKDHYNDANMLISNNKFDDALKIIKEYKLDMNKKYYHNNNTIYHKLSIVLFKINKKDIIKMFTEYQSPELVENMLLLTYRDYLNYNVNFS